MLHLHTFDTAAHHLTCFLLNERRRSAPDYQKHADPASLQGR